uniref:Uncharacterized protein n=1 Tax=Arundo donax TaxID=35708 RepID=A0A0A9HXG2_ARUDO
MLVTGAGSIGRRRARTHSYCGPRQRTVLSISSSSASSQGADSR